MQSEASDFQDQLVRGLTHRMNNILTLFHGYLGLLLDNKKLDQSTKEGLARIKEGARAASELMERTHTLVRPSTAVWREVKLGELLLMMRSSFEPLRGPQTTLDFAFPNELPTVWVDAARIRTTIFEIVRNALEATLEAGGVVKIELSTEMQLHLSNASLPTKWVSLTVSDDGPGICEKVGERIFHPFFTTKKKQNGTGLGLTVARGFAQQLGGVLRYTSEPGRTVFQLLLPARSEAV